MNGSKSNKGRKWLKILSGLGMSALIAPAAIAQQEVSPTWYDPWPIPQKVVAQTKKPKPPNRDAKQKNSASAVLPPHEKDRLRLATSQRRSAAAARRSSVK
jgi:hypothetical protein